MNKTVFHIFFLLILCNSNFAQNLTSKRMGDLRAEKAELMLIVPENILPLPYKYRTEKQAVEVQIFKGEAFKEGIDGFVFFNPANEIKDNKTECKILALQYYQNPTIQRIENDSAGTIYIHSNNISTLNPAHFFAPFYMKQFQVSNVEYREFMVWVRDSIARKLLAEAGETEFMMDKNAKGEPLQYPLLNWEKEIDWNHEALQSLWLPQNERFYRTKELDVRKLIYRFYDFDAQKVVNVAVYPDTTLFVEWNNAMKNNTLQNYFHQKEFNDFPVLGIHSVLMAKAFCNWKSQQLNNQIRTLNSGFYVEVGLPTAYEWEYVQTKYRPNIAAKEGAWLLNLMDYRIIEAFSNSAEQIERSNLPVKINLNFNLRKPENTDKSTVYFMGDYVCEWLNETYNKNWKQYFELRQSLIRTPDIVELNLLSEMETKMNEWVKEEKNTSEQHLIYGQVLLNNRFIEKGLGEYQNSMYGKTFAEKFEAGNVSFRYVIRIKRIEFN